MAFRSVLVRLVVLLPALAAADEAAVPPLLYRDVAESGGAPVWVAASLALDETGLPHLKFAELAGEQLVVLNDRGGPLPPAAAPPGSLPTVRNAFRRTLTPEERSAMRSGEAPAAELRCPDNDILFGRDWDAVLPAERIVDRAALAEEVWLLEIRSLDVGFSMNMPHTLLDTRVRQVLRSGSAVTTGERILVAYRFARFRAGDTLWCNMDPRFDLRPQAGDRLLMIRQPRSWEFTTNGWKFLVPDEYQILLARPDDTLAWPGVLRALDPQTPAEVDSLPELLEQIQAATKAGRASP